MLPFRALFTFISIVLAAAAAPPDASAAPRQADTRIDGWVLTMPKRRATDAPPAAPPTLPARAAVTPSTIDIVVRKRRPGRKTSSSRQTVSRTADRIHLAGKDGREWLFERNRIDQRRVSATFVDHSSQAIVLYEESDLRMTRGIRGWADVLTLGFSAERLDTFMRTNEERNIGGIRFVRYAPPAGDGSGGDVWWSDDQAIASSFAIADGATETRLSIAGVRMSADEALLRPAIARFPHYRVFDLADWLERH